MSNKLKTSLINGDQIIGLWAGLAQPYVTDLLLTANFDWLLIDGEHGPNNLHTVLHQLQIMDGHDVIPIVRPSYGSPTEIKKLLDIGAKNLLIPMVNTAEQALSIVGSTRYPPVGYRGVGTSLARASRWNGTPHYIDQANEDICVLVQVESVEGIRNLEAILMVDGVDGVFFGPADLAASMGYIGQPLHDEVVTVIKEGIAMVNKHNKSAGLLSSDHNFIRQCLELDAQFVAVGTDASLLANAARDLAAQYKA